MVQKTALFVFGIGLTNITIGRTSPLITPYSADVTVAIFFFINKDFDIIDSGCGGQAFFSGAVSAVNDLLGTPVAQLKCQPRSLV